MPAKKKVTFAPGTKKGSATTRSSSSRTAPTRSSTSRSSSSRSSSSRPPSKSEESPGFFARSWNWVTSWFKSAPKKDQQDFLKRTGLKTEKTPGGGEFLTYPTLNKEQAKIVSDFGKTALSELKKGVSVEKAFGPIEKFIKKGPGKEVTADLLKSTIKGVGKGKEAYYKPLEKAVAKGPEKIKPEMTRKPLEKAIKQIGKPVGAAAPLEALQKKGYAATKAGPYTNKFLDILARKEGAGFKPIANEAMRRYEEEIFPRFGAELRPQGQKRSSAFSGAKIKGARDLASQLGALEAEYNERQQGRLAGLTPQLLGAERAQEAGQLGLAGAAAPYKVNEAELQQRQLGQLLGERAQNVSEQQAGAGQQNQLIQALSNLGISREQLQQGLLGQLLGQNQFQRQQGFREAAGLTGAYQGGQQLQNQRFGTLAGGALTPTTASAFQPPAPSAWSALAGGLGQAVGTAAPYLGLSLAGLL